MPGPYPFSQIFAADPFNTAIVATGASVLLFAPGDASMTPLVITDASTGRILANPVQTNANGWGPAFAHETLDQVAWEGGGFNGTFESYRGMKDAADESAGAAKAAADSAQEAATNAAETVQEALAGTVAEVEAAKLAAQAAAGLVGAPAGTAVLAAISPGGAAEAALNAAIETSAIAPDGGVRSVGKGELVVNVKDYGALGDGVTDGTAAVQAAMDAIKLAGGGTLWFPNGEYVVHGNVILCDNVNITGTKGAVIRKTTGSINYAVFVGLAGSNLGYGGGVKNVSLTGLTFRGNLGAGVSISAMTLHRASDVYVSNCRFLETSQNGHVFDLLGCDNIFIERSEFRGVKLVTNRSYVEAIQLDSSVKYGFGAHDSLKAGEVFDGTATRNVTVRGCTFGSITVGGIKYLAQPPLGSHSWVEGNYYTNIVFEDNDVSEVQETTADSYPGILHFVAAKQVYIRNNRIDGSGISNHFVRTISHATGTLLADINLEPPRV